MASSDRKSDFSEFVCFFPVDLLDRLEFFYKIKAISAELQFVVVSLINFK